MSERPHIMGSPPEGGKFKLVVENGSVQFIGMVLQGPRGKEKPEEVNLIPPNGTKVIFARALQLALKNGSILTLKGSKGAVLCQVEFTGYNRPQALMFPDRIVLLEWLVPDQEVKLFSAPEDPRSNVNHYYSTLCG